MFPVIFMSLIYPFTTSNARNHQDYSTKAHNSGKRSVLIQEVPPALRSLGRTHTLTAASYLYSTDLHRDSSRSWLCIWYQAATRVWPSRTFSLVQATVQSVHQKSPYRARSSFIATFLEQWRTQCPADSLNCFLTVALLWCWMVFKCSHFQFLLNIKLLCWPSTVPSHFKTESTISFLVFYGSLYQHLDMEILQSDISQSAAYVTGRKKPRSRPVLFHRWPWDCFWSSGWVLPEVDCPSKMRMLY